MGRRAAAPLLTLEPLQLELLFFQLLLQPAQRGALLLGRGLGLELLKLLLLLVETELKRAQLRRRRRGALRERRDRRDDEREQEDELPHFYQSGDGAPPAPQQSARESSRQRCGTAEPCERAVEKASRRVPQIPGFSEKAALRRRLCGKAVARRKSNVRLRRRGSC